MKYAKASVVSASLGRKATEAEVANVEHRIAGAMRELAARDPAAWRKLSQYERVARAGEEAVATLRAESANRERSAELQIIVGGREADKLETLLLVHRTAAETLCWRLDEIGEAIKGIYQEFFGSLMAALLQTEGQFFSMLQEPRGARDFARELWGEDSGNAVASKGARVWLDTMGAMRQRYIGAGGDPRKLEYGRLPLPHDAVRVGKLTPEQWADQVLPRLDREHYYNDDVTPFSDAQMRQLLRALHDAITGIGSNPLELDPHALRRKEGRDLHFKDAQHYLNYLRDFGRGSMFDAMQWHVSGFARAIGLVEQLGPSPRTLFGFLNEMAVKHDRKRVPVTVYAIHAPEAFQALSGFTASTTAAHQSLARIAYGARNWEVQARLFGLMLITFENIPEMFVTARYDQLPVLGTFASAIQAAGKQGVEYASRIGLVCDSVKADMSRWAESTLCQPWTGKQGDASFRASLMTVWTDAMRRAYGVMMMGALGQLLRQDWSDLEAGDRERLATKGITAQDWTIYRKATPEVWRGSRMLTPGAVRAVEHTDQRALDLAVVRLLGLIQDESELNAPKHTRGKTDGELARSLELFRTFCLSLGARYLRRTAATQGVLHLAYLMQLVVGLTVFGALSVQAGNLLRGDPPRDMTLEKFWGLAAHQGGGLCLFGERFYEGMGGARHRYTAAQMSQALTGQIFGLGLDAAQKKPLLNLWYLRAALGHMVLHEIQDQINPGYLKRTQDLAQRLNVTEYWWEQQA